MDKALYKATVEGNTEILGKLIQEDGLILDRTSSTTTLLETPLHIAAMLGNEEYSIMLLRLKPGLASELDWRRSSALHLGAAKGYVGVVKALLRVDPDMCFACDRDGRNPVHVAAMRGRVDALREMLGVKPEAALALVNNRETILHLCVEYSQFEALKLLLESVDFGALINSKDRSGDTLLHLAVADKQVETTEFLLSLPGIEVNALNVSGMTPMDILIQRRMDVRDLELEESLKRAGASGHQDNNPPTFVHQNVENAKSFFPHPVYLSPPPNLPKNTWKNLLNHQDDWLERTKSALMIVASLIATMAFQVGVNPPNMVLQESTNAPESAPTQSNNDPQGPRHYMTIIYNYLKKYGRFYMINTTGFIASLSIILLLMSGLPIRRKVFMWILLVITWVAITALALTYTVSVIILTPAVQQNSIDAMIGITVFVWICLMALLLFGHTLRLFVKMVRVLFRPFSGRRMKSEVKLPRNNFRV